MNGPDMLECYISLGWKGLPGSNTINYKVQSLVMRDMKCCEHDTFTLYLRVKLDRPQKEAGSSLPNSTLAYLFKSVYYAKICYQNLSPNFKPKY